MSTALNLGFTLAFDPFGKLVVTLADGTQHVGAVVARAFPIATPDQCISILSAEGKELVWVENLNDLPVNERDIVAQALQGREFMPEILRLDGVNSFSTPSIWRVQTNRGPAQLVLKGEEDIRRLSASRLIVADAHGVQFLIRDLPSLDRHTRKLLDRFL
ncbi:hypothetical protein B9Z36_10925 [Limnohabitans sp. Rim8]|jgi:hypothetical protein|uniref:DUF1854 domain-containing protein n=1 Tax=Limnohabitans curvus TaxID=323423 RepID=A0A315EMA6_9BURK|nr:MULTISPECIES: DUF1854 domain-containing protein [Limnohabitans]PUE56151.1 hypothetical protein B9Z36_10925 [Limnohabitans sp. Rim8]PUE58381.1 hypothetical protein B9Z44_01445 [Limnohabitans curvus]